MTREEAIALLNEQCETCKRIYDCSADQRKSYPNVPQFMEALGMALSALRPVSREQVEKMKSPWKSYFNGDYNDEIYYCEECGHKLESASKLPNFCPDCGVPKTDEAVEMVMEKMEALKDG